MASRFLNAIPVTRRTSLMLGTAMIICITATTARADDVSATSRVTAATIFPGRALITRESKIRVPSGAHTIVIADAPAGLDEDSLRVQGKANGEVKIGTVEVKHVFLTESANAAVREKQTQIQAKQDEKAMIQAQVQALQSRRAFIEKIAANGAEKTDVSGTTKLDFTPEKWTQAWGSIQNGMDETLKGLTEKAIAERKVDTDINKLMQELAQIQSQQAHERRDLRINVEAAADTEVNLQLTYQTGNASWAPLYDARLNTNDGSLALEQYGRAVQTTGEDWNDISLTFSTARPNMGSEMPQLSDWFVQLFNPMPMARGFAAERSALGGAAQASQNMAMDAMEPVASPAPMMKAVALPQAEVVSSEFAAEFKVPGHVDLKSTQDATKLFIRSAHMTATLNAQVTPRLMQSAYLFAKAKNEENYPLIPGSIAKYRDGAFIGNAALQLLRPGETEQLSFGVDDRIKVTYKRTREEQQNPTLVIVGDRKIEREYETKVQNLHKEPVDITVFEQYPVARDADVTAELIDSATTPNYVKDPEKRQGVIAWTSSFKPQEEKTFDLGFRVKYPKDRQLTGL